MVYKPDINEYPIWDTLLASYCYSRIGILIFMLGLGWIHFSTEVLLLSPQLELHRKVHLEAVFHLFALLCQNYNLRVLFDSIYPDIDFNSFKRDD